MKHHAHAIGVAAIDGLEVAMIEKRPAARQR